MPIHSNLLNDEQLRFLSGRFVMNLTVHEPDAVHTRFGFSTLHVGLRAFFFSKHLSKSSQREFRGQDARMRSTQTM